MAKSNRRRKQDRAKAATKHAEAQRRRARTARMRAMEVRLARIHDPGTPAAELAALVAEQYRGVPVAGWLVPALLAEGSSLERLEDSAQLILAADSAGQGAPSLTALTFAAAVARAAGNAEGERRLIDGALAAADEAGDPDTRLEVIDFISVSGHAAEAVELLEPRLRQAPDDEFAADLYGAAIAKVYAKASQAEATDAERAALRRFADRSGLIALRDAVGAFLAGTELGQAVQAQVTEELSAAEDIDWPPGDRVAFGKLAEELALLTATLAGDRDDTPDDVGDLRSDDDPSGTPLRAFAANASTPSALAAGLRPGTSTFATACGGSTTPVPAPGLWCTDIVSGTVRYVEFPAEATAGLARWTAWLGGVVPVDGIWRTTGLGVRLSPAEADAAAEFVDQAALAMVHAVEGLPEPPPMPMRFGQAEPRGVYADDQEPVAPGIAKLMGRVTSALLTRITADVHRYRSTPPTMLNTDGDPMCLITATIAVGTGAADRLAARPDFEPDADEPERITWWGALIADGQRETMMAEAAAQLRAQGHRDVELPEGPQRWVRGVLRVHDGEITAEVNSGAANPAARHTPQGGRRAGGHRREADRPGAGLRLAGGSAPFQRGAAGPAEGWEKHWLDENVPALHGRTPGRPRTARSGRTWRRCCGSSSTRPTCSPLKARPASTPPGYASSWICQAISPTERPPRIPPSFSWPERPRCSARSPAWARWPRGVGGIRDRSHLEARLAMIKLGAHLPGHVARIRGRLAVRAGRHRPRRGRRGGQGLAAFVGDSATPPKQPQPPRGEPRGLAWHAGRASGGRR